MTAIAMVEPFDDEFLNGLLSLLRHDAAAGLWKLAVAATSTPAENDIHMAADAARDAGRLDVGGLLLVEEALNLDVAWHSAVRFQVAANIARDLLTGSEAMSNEQMLYGEHGAWAELQWDLRLGGTRRTSYQRGVNGYNWDGRGATAVWRARRRVAVQDFEEWLLGQKRAGPACWPVTPPGWRLRLPGDWRAVAVGGSGQALAEPYATWVATGQLLTFAIGRKQVVWPVMPVDGSTGPVAGIEPIIAATSGMRADQIIGFVEAVLVDWQDAAAASADSQYRISLSLPASQAFELGLIDAEQRRAATVSARATTLDEMQAIIDALPKGKRVQRAALEGALGKTRLFHLRCNQFGIKADISVTALWAWQGRTVLEEIALGTPSSTVQTLALHAFKSAARALRWSTEHAWREGFLHPNSRMRHRGPGMRPAR